MVLKKLTTNNPMNKKIINQLVLNGKTAVSEKIWLKSIKFFYKSFAKNHKKCINQALVSIAPLIKVKQLKQKSKRSQLKEFPYIVDTQIRVSLALKFFLGKKKRKNELKLHKKLIAELLAVINSSSVNLVKKKNLYEYAFVKKKYFFYRWF
jgi:ribosomal protein S7